MLPYQLNSDALLPPLELPPLPVDPVFIEPLSDEDSVFALFFFSFLISVCSAVDFGRLDLACVDDLVAFASTAFLGVELGFGFGVGFAIAFGFGVAFGAGVSNGVGFGNSISLFA